MEPAMPVNKKIVVAGGILLVVLLAIITAFMSSRRTAAPTQQAPSPSASNPADVNTILSYRPPAGAHYSGLGDINFLPAKINNFTIDREKLLTQAKKSYPRLSQSELIDAVNQSLFFWAAMNDFYKNADPAKVSSTYKLNGPLSGFVTIDNEYHTMAREYSADVIKLDGFFIRIRFDGIRQENLSRLGKQQSTLKTFARSTLGENMQAALKFSDMSQIVDLMNNDSTIRLMNNGDMSARFAGRSIAPPLVSDTTYYSWIQKLPVGRFSDVVTLREYDAQNRSQRDYAYAAFYISKKTGTHLPLNVLTNQFISKATIQ